MPTSTWFRLDGAKRARVLEAAMREFGEHGYSTGSLNTIAREAEIAKGSLFQYFRDKLEFFAYVCDEASRHITEEMDRRITEDADFRQPFTDWMVDVTFLWSEYFAEHPLERGIVAATNLEIDNSVRLVVRETAGQHYLRSIRQFLRLWRDRGEIRPEIEDDILESLLLMLLPHLALAPYYDGLDPVLGLRGLSPEQQRPIIRRFVTGIAPIYEKR